MKISNSKKELARIISENGGWRDGAEFFASTCNGIVIGSKSKPKYTSKYGWVAAGGFIDDRIELHSYLKNWHQTILSRDEYSHLYPMPDADGWIEWSGGECPVGEGDRIDVKFSDGDEFFDVSSYWGWGADAGCCNIIAYRLHKPEQAQPEFCESVVRSIPEPDELVWTNQPTIEHLAADYRNAKDYFERKQQEADDAKADAEAKLAELVAAGKELGLVLSVVAPESELVITDWRDLKVGDIIQCVGSWEEEKTDGMQLPVMALEGPHYNGDLPIRVDVPGISCPDTWGINFKFIRRP